VLPPSSCTPAQQLNMGDWKKSLIFLETTKNISVIDILLLNSKHDSYWEEN